ncbi:HD family phosphohydrolase [Desulfonatronovibrio magnus]|uniref:HD family phosphohydrolase n=1 Tax=Desulfonatronovibrio magnus TaxID=698827 RepID=UPI000698D03C|nr:HD family phosphohydrolase [Desulfonatronovibrio magnus]
MQKARISGIIDNLNRIALSLESQGSAPEDLGRDLQYYGNELKSLLSDQVSFFKKLTTIGLSLSKEKNISDILERILKSSRDLTGADGGSLYLADWEKKVLTFEIVQNQAMNISLRADKFSMDKFAPVPLYHDNQQPNTKNVSSYVALKGEKVNIPDVYQAEGFDFSGTRAYDQKSGYRSKSMLVIPMQNHEDKIIGVLQLINAIDPETGAIVPFTNDAEEIVGALASQAAVVLTKTQLIQELENLFDAFIKSIACAIDGKSYHTGRHVDRVVELALTIARAINETQEGPLAKITFSGDELDELRVASWLHDVGKIATPEYILDKRFKLESIWDKGELIKSRFSYIALCMENEFLRQNITKDESKLDSSELEKKKQLLMEEMQFVLECNSTGRFITDDEIHKLQKIASKSYTCNGQQFPYITPDELDLLSIRKGNLSPVERQAIENHALITRKILEQLPFPKKLSRVADIASMHHERIDGSGYPLGLKDDEILFQAKIVAVADVFEALTARDRPYKKPIPLTKALQILEFMKKDRHLDSDIVDFFIENRIYENYETHYLKQAPNNEG